MFVKKILIFSIGIALFGNSLAQTDSKNPPPKTDTAPEVQEKAIKLLTRLAGDAEQFSLPQNRIMARTLVANLLWDSDEKQARALFQSAINELNLLIGQLPIEPPEEESDEESYERYNRLNDAKTLRSDLLLKIAARDPKFALESMQLLARKNADGASIFEEDQTLELDLATQIAAKDPKQAYDLAKKNLENGLSANLYSTLEDLYKKDSELGAKLAQDILSKLKSRDTTISSSSDYVGNASVMSNGAVIAKSNGLIVNVWEVQSFLESVKKLNRQAAKDKKPNLLADNEIKDLIEILAQKYVRQQYLSSYEVSKIMPEISKFFPAQAQAIRAKLGQAESATLNNLIGDEAFQNEIEDKPIEEVLQIIEKKPVADRDNLYYQAAQKSFGANQIEDAKKLYGKMKVKREGDYLDKQIANALPLELAKKGDLSEVRQALARLKSPEERIEVLTALAQSVAESGDKKTAVVLFGEARSIYTGRMKSRKNLASIMQLAQAASVVEPEQGFSIIETNVNYFNDIIGAAIVLDEFNEVGAVKDEELRLETVQAEAYRSVPDSVRLIKNFAAADFDRAVNLADKFARSEARFFAAFRIAEAILDPNAEKIEKDFQTKISQEEYDH